MRELSPEELFGVKPLQPTEQRRWKNRKMVAQDYGPEFQARLNELREKSKELTAILAKKFTEANLPFGIKKDQAGIIRLSFFSAPLFYSLIYLQHKKPSKDITPLMMKFPYFFI